MSTRRRPGPAVAAALVAALVVTLAAPMGVPGLVDPATTRGAATDLTLVTDAVYTVHPSDGRVGVAVAIEARNRTSETRTRRFWFDHAFLAVQPGAANVRLTGARGADVRIARRTRNATLLRLDLGPRLYSGERAALRLTFDLPGTGRSAARQVRVSSGLVTIPVWAFASNGARGSTVAVRFPDGWDVAVESGELDRRGAGTTSGTVLESGPIARPLTWFAYVSAQRPAVFTDRPVSLAAGDRQVALVLRGWKDDPAWSRRIGTLFAAALPVLREDIGLPWPMTGPLVIEESVSRDADAFASVFDPAEGRMEIAYWADDGVIVHQAAHGWFNGSLLTDRWVNEGFATYYGLRAADALDEPADAPRMTEAAQDAAQPLNAWAGATGEPTPADDHGYAASYALAATIAERVGPDVLAAVWADAASRTGAYQPPTAAGGGATPAAPEGVAGASDWRGLLDLLEAHSGADLVPLWRESVVRPEEAALLDARATARASYARTLALAGDWQLPRAVRDALRAWEFAAAETMMADARTVIAQRNAGEERARRAGLELPGVMRGLFESGSMDEASARADAEHDAMVAIEQAAVSRSSADDVLSRIGMVGEDPEQDLASARAALAAGDLEASVAAADRAHRAWTVGWEEGRRRALLALAVLATLIVLGSAAASNLRRSRPLPAATTGRGAAPAPDDHAAGA